MDAKILKRWTAALRSGKFKKGTGALKEKDEKGVVTWCCLGVLCELHRRTHGPRWRWFTIDNCLYYGSGPANRKVSYLPAAVAKWAGLKNETENPFVLNSRGKGVMASEMNDEKRSDDNRSRYSFPNIAAAIERAQEKETL